MRGTLPTVAGKQLREPFALGVAPAGRQGAVGGSLGCLQRLVHDRRAGVGQDDQRQAGVTVVRLTCDEPDPLERGDLPGDARRCDPQAFGQLGAAQLARRL